MSDVSSNTTRLNQTKEAMNKRQSFELKKINSEYETELKTVREKNEKELNKTKKDYEVVIAKEKNENEIKLNKLRTAYNARIKDETQRYEKLLVDLKENGADRMNETKISQEGQIANQELKHKEYLEKARRKFEDEKAKLES